MALLSPPNREKSSTLQTCRDRGRGPSPVPEAARGSAIGAGSDPAATAGPGRSRGTPGSASRPAGPGRGQHLHHDLPEFKARGRCGRGGEVSDAAARRMGDDRTLAGGPGYRETSGSARTAFFGAVSSDAAAAETGFLDTTVGARGFAAADGAGASASSAGGDSGLSGGRQERKERKEGKPNR